MDNGLFRSSLLHFTNSMPLFPSQLRTTSYIPFASTITLARAFLFFFFWGGFILSLIGLAWREWRLQCLLLNYNACMWSTSSSVPPPDSGPILIWLLLQPPFRLQFHFVSNFSTFLCSFMWIFVFYDFVFHFVQQLFHSMLMGIILSFNVYRHLFFLD